MAFRRDRDPRDTGATLTRRGRVLMVEGVLLYVLARAISIGELYALALAAIVFPALSLAFVRWGRHRVDFARTITPARVFAGGQIRFEYSVHNLGRISSPPLILDDPTHSGLGGAVRVALPSLAPDKRGAVAVERSVGTRGRYGVGPLRARLVDPFGLAEAVKILAPVAAVVVYPRVEFLHEASPPESRAGGGRSLIQRLATAGEEFYAVRDWQDGDDLRKIHWRSSARRGSLQVRQDEIRPFPRATLFVDTRTIARAPSGGDAALEYAISATASMIWELARQGFAIRLATADAGPGEARWGREATDPLLGVLASVGPARVADLTGAARRLGSRPGAGGALIALLPPPDASSLAALTRLRRAYQWAGAVLLDGPSFVPGSGTERARYDQRLAETERSLARVGWRVVIAGSKDRYPTIWQTLLGSGASRPISRSRPS